MVAAPQKIVINYTDRQKQAYNALLRDDVKTLMYGGAKGGGKSFFLCTWVFDFSMWVIHKFGLKPSKNPPHLGWMGRKQATDFTATTLQTWRQIIPEQYYELKGGTEKDSKHILIMGRVAIDYGGLDRQESINKFNSAEYSFFAIDQAEEVTRDEVSVLRGSLRLQIKGKVLPYKEIYTANPRQCWLKDDFIIDKLPGNVFVPALPRDNPNLPDGYEQTLINAFGYRPELLAAYLEGDWSRIEDEAQIIRDLWIQRAMTGESMYVGKILSCDPARFGDDTTEIMLMNGTEVDYEETIGYSRTTEISSRLTELSRQNGNCPIVVDVIGIGAGVVDELYTWGRNVIPFNSSEKAFDDKKYYNKRAEAWWECAEDFARGKVGCHRMDTELRRQLCQPRYELRNGRILVEPKADIKQRLGKSPDKADCYIMGVYGVKNAMPEPEIAGWGRENDQPFHYSHDPLDARKLR